MFVFSCQYGFSTPGSLKVPSVVWSLLISLLSSCNGIVTNMLRDESQKKYSTGITVCQAVSIATYFSSLSLIPARGEHFHEVSAFKNVVWRVPGG